MRETEYPPMHAKKSARGIQVFLRDMAIIVVSALTLSFAVKTFLVRSFFIPSGSMENNLQVNDRILVNQLSPKIYPLNNGDVVVFRDPGGWLIPQPKPKPSPLEWVFESVGLTAASSDEHLVKRVIGLPGDRVQCCSPEGKVIVNGVPVNESYVKLPTPGAAVSNTPFDQTVPEGMLWVLGDNRYHSADSRYNTDKPQGGFVPIDDVVGVVFLVNWPIDRIHFLKSEKQNFSTK